MARQPKPDQDRDGIWLEVAEVRFESGTEGACSVLLKADREQPRPVWWPVDETSASVKGAAEEVNATSAKGTAAFETYKAILHELDKKRTVLALLGCGREDENHWLRCRTFRFQAPELGSR